MSDIERTCHHLRTERHKRAAERIASDNFENEFFHQQPGMQHAIVDHIAERLKTPTKTLGARGIPFS